MDLVARCKGGDEAACAELYQTYENLIYRTAFMMLSGSHEAENALQEVFIRVLDSLDTYDPQRAKFTTWLYRVTVNYCLEQHRRKQLELTSLDDLPAPSQPGITRRLEDQISAEENMRQMLRPLNEDFRLVIVLRYYWDLSYKEIAEILDVPLGTVQSRLNRALKQIREQVEPIKESVE